MTDGWRSAKKTSSKRTQDRDEHAQVTPDLYTGEPPLQSAHKIWKQVQKDLAYALGSNVHRAWTARLHISDACTHTVTLNAPSSFVASKIESAYSDTVRRLWNKYDVVIPPRQVIIAAPARTRPSPARNGTSHTTSSAPKTALKGSRANDNGYHRGPASPPAKMAEMHGAPAEMHMGHKAQARFTFENFVVGPSNELAYAVARQITHNAEPTYNPVIIHGDNGMGKTHLLSAVKESLETDHPERRVHFLSSEDFVNSFVRSFRGPKSKNDRAGIEAFKASLRDVDVLIIDDAHFIADKPGSQEELLHTLIALVGNGRQILLASDRHPDKIEKASQRLKSYLSSGLICRIGAAEYDLRRRIVDRLVQRRQASGHTALTIPQKTRDLLAAKINGTPRDLEGAFNQVVAQAEFLGKAVTMESVQDTLSDTRYIATQRITVDKIQKATVEAFGITLDDMISKRRSRDIARPRQVAMYLCKKLTKRSLPDIGRRFGGRDHTTVMHAIKRITELRTDDASFDQQINDLEHSLTHVDR